MEVPLTIIMFSIFTSLENNYKAPSAYPWVKTVSYSVNILLIPIIILFSIFIGFIIGFIVLKYIEFRNKTDNIIVNFITIKSIGKYFFMIFHYLSLIQI